MRSAVGGGANTNFLLFVVWDVITVVQNFVNEAFSNDVDMNSKCC